jgi:protein required for attachment to host cells
VSFRGARDSASLSHVLERGHADKSFTSLVLVAPPKLLGELRENLGKAVQSASVAELHKDYGHCAVDELKKLLRSELPV